MDASQRIERILLQEDSGYEVEKEENNNYVIRHPSKSDKSIKQDLRAVNGITFRQDGEPMVLLTLWSDGQLKTQMGGGWLAQVQEAPSQ